MTLRGVCCAALFLATAVVRAEPLFPDLIPVIDPNVEPFSDLNEDPTKVFFRFGISIPNIGTGPFELHDEDLPNGTQ